MYDSESNRMKVSAVSLLKELEAETICSGHQTY
jgi:hypothetical protein